jgi:hypothetical protein
VDRSKGANSHLFESQRSYFFRTFHKASRFLRAIPKPGAAFTSGLPPRPPRRLPGAEISWLCPSSCKAPASPPPLHNVHASHPACAYNGFGKPLAEQGAQSANREREHAGLVLEHSPSTQELQYKCSGIGSF